MQISLWGYVDFPSCISLGGNGIRIIYIIRGAEPLRFDAGTFERYTVDLSAP